MLFTTLPGYDEVKKSLLQVGAGHRVPHALLFTGPTGSPVVPLALGFIQYLFCEVKQAEGPCGWCSSCEKTSKLIHPDVHLLFPVSGSEGEGAADEDTLDKLLKPFRSFILNTPFGSPTDWGNMYGAGNRQPIINVRDVRKLIGNLSLKSYEGGYKVAFVWLPELMNVSGANALLKMLEEPPERTIFILATYEQDALLATIISRVLQVRVRPAEDVEIAVILAEKGISSTVAAEAILGAEGSISRALELADQQDLGLQDRFLTWMRACYSLNYIDLAAQADDFAKLGREGQKWMVSYSLSVFRRMLRHKVVQQSALPSEAHTALVKFFDAVPLNTIEPTADQLEYLYNGIVRNASAKLSFLAVSIKMGHALRGQL